MRLSAIGLAAALVAGIGAPLSAHTIDLHRLRLGDGKLSHAPTGVALLNALDSPGRDAVAHETQDRCDGHPQEDGVYHYNSLSACIDDQPGPDGNSPLVGYALDGFRIYGSYAGGKQLSTADLDACHGRVSVIDWDGRKVRMYHYVATVDFPYTIGCLRGDYDQALVREIGGGGPRRRAPRGMRPPGPLGFGPPPGGPPLFGTRRRGEISVRAGR